MESFVRDQLNNLYNPDTVLQQKALAFILELTEEPVDWAAEVWEEMISMLKSYDSNERSMAAQILANLAKNVPARMLKDFDHLKALTIDTNLSTAVTAIGSFWKIGIINAELRDKVVELLSNSFKTSEYEKDHALKRYGIIECFRRIYNEVKDDALRNKSLTLVALDPDRPNRIKYGSVWIDLAKVKKKPKPPFQRKPSRLE